MVVYNYSVCGDVRTGYRRDYQNAVERHGAENVRILAKWEEISDDDQ